MIFSRSVRDVRLFSLISLSLLLGAQKTQAAPMAKVLRAGKGVVTISSSWPEGYKLPSQRENGKYIPTRLDPNVISQTSSDIQNTWASHFFTDPSELKVGEELEKFKFIVHGLELKCLEGSLSKASFDDFVMDVLKPIRDVRGINFIRYYPYFFHKKTIISASVISENLTATFGQVGFILGVPAGNLISSSRTDMQSLTDRRFYDGWYRSDVFAYQLSQFPVVPLDKLLPDRPVNPERARYQTKLISQSQSDQLAMVVAKVGSPATPAHWKEGLSTGQVRLSWYNEIAINPYISSNQVTTLQGVFLKVDPDANQLALFLKRPEVLEMLKVARAFDLPVIQVYDGQSYETLVGIDL